MKIVSVISLVLLISSAAFAGQRKISCSIYSGAAKIFDQTVELANPAYFLVVGNTVSKSSAEALVDAKEDSTLIYIESTGSGELRVGASHLPNSKLAPEFETSGGAELEDGATTALYVNRNDSDTLAISCFRFTPVAH